MIPAKLRRSAEFLARQLTLALDDMTGRLGVKMKKAPAPMKEAEDLIKRALRLIDRASKDGAYSTGLMLRSQCKQFFGTAELWKIGTALC